MQLSRTRAINDVARQQEQRQHNKRTLASEATSACLLTGTGERMTTRSGGVYGAAALTCFVAAVTRRHATTDRALGNPKNTPAIRPYTKVSGARSGCVAEK